MDVWISDVRLVWYFCHSLVFFSFALFLFFIQASSFFSSVISFSSFLSLSLVFLYLLLIFYFFFSSFLPLFFSIREEKWRPSFPSGKMFLWAGLRMSSVCDVTKQTVSLRQFFLINSKSASLLPARSHDWFYRWYKNIGAVLICIIIHIHAFLIF